MSKKAGVAYPIRLEKAACATLDAKLKRAAWQLKKLDELGACFAQDTVIRLPEARSVENPEDMPGECDPLPGPVSEITVADVAGWVRKAQTSVRGASQVLARAGKSKTAAKKK